MQGRIRKRLKGLLGRGVFHGSDRRAEGDDTPEQMRVSAEEVDLVYDRLLGRPPEFDSGIHGQTPLQFCLEVALSEERRALMRKEFREELAAANGYHVSRTVNGHMVSRAGDHVIGRALVDGGAFEEGDIAIALQAVAKRQGNFRLGTFLDVGANIGTHGLRALDHGFSRVVSVEPDATNFRLLRINQILNGCDGACINLHAAASDHDGEGLLELSADNFGDHRVRTAAQGTGAETFGESLRNLETTRLARIDTLLRDAGISASDIGLVWMDTQGHEGHALSGAASLRSARVPIVAEFWPYGLHRAGGYRKFRAFLSQGVQIQALRKAGNSGDGSFLGLEDLDRFYAETHAAETPDLALHMDLLILFDGA